MSEAARKVEAAASFEGRLVNGRDAVAEWLDLLEKLTDLPASERADVREELEGHLRERVRDLMLAGRSEEDSISAAIAEIGDAAVLAKGLGRGRQLRRHRMNIAAIVAVGAAMVTGAVVSLRPPTVVPSARMGGLAGSMAALESLEPGAKTLDEVVISCTRETNWTDFFQMIASELKLPMHVQWARLQNLQGEAKVLPEDAIGFEFKDMPVTDALSMINELRSAEGDDGVGIVVKSRWVLVSTIAQLDKLDRVERTINIGPLVALAAMESGRPEFEVRDQVVDHLQALITDMISPNLWTSNGGDRAMMNNWGDTLFFAAPSRVTNRVEKLLAELIEQAHVQARNFDEQKRAEQKDLLVLRAELRARSQAENEQAEQQEAAVRQRADREAVKRAWIAEKAAAAEKPVMAEKAMPAQPAQPAEEPAPTPK